MERVQKVIANKGYCSRRKVEELIEKGKVFINGEKATLGSKVDANDTIEVEGHVLEDTQKEYILLYKPRGVVTTTSDDKNRKTVIDLIETNKRLYPIGRLDYDTSGLLLLTNDGDLTNLLTHPKNQLEKLKSGVMVDGVKTSKAQGHIKKIDKKTNSSIVELIIHEGKNHQVKKMFEAVGYNVSKLKRERIAFLTLAGLKPGEYRYLNPKEVKQLYC